MSSDSWRSLRPPLLSLLFASLASACAHQSLPHGTLVSNGASGTAQASDQARKHRLVNVRSAIPDIVIDLRYATAYNITGRPLYPADMPCLLREETADKLKKAQSLLRAQGYGLCIWDAYRPPEAQEALHKHGGSTGMFLSPNAGWSRHCGGIAIDLTLVDAQGRPQSMPTGFDQDFAHASRNYTGKDPVVKQNLQLLQTAMKQAGFIQLESEWWHFDDGDYLHNPQPIVYGWQLSLPAISPP